MDSWKVIFVTIFIFGIVQAKWPSCNDVLKTPGITVPRGKITLLKGDTLAITCILDPLDSIKANSSDLRFFRNTDLIVNNETHSLKIVNETALQLHIVDVQPSYNIYICAIVKRDNENDKIGVCSNVVEVGTLPQNVNNFNCISNNWESLTCTWKPDEVNYVQTNYSLLVKYDGRAGRNILTNCPRIKFNEGVYRCMWDLTTDPPYSQSYQFFKFNLTGYNVFGSNTQLITFDHFANIKPAPPIDLRISDVSSHGALISWSVDYNMVNFVTGLVHRVVYCIKLEEECSWIEEYISPSTSNSTMRHIMKLEYPNIRYDVRVFIKTEKSSDLWSDFSSTWFKTSSTIPSKSPDVNIGGFESSVESSDTRQLIVYWRQIEKFEENGENITYKIVKSRIDNKDVLLEPLKITKSYMMFDKLPHNEIEIHIKSFNSEGSSEQESYLSIPSVDKILPEPRSFRKWKTGDRLYSLSWKKVTHPDLISYTIFWCEDLEDINSCESRIQWETVPSNITTKNITVDSKYLHLFAISANSLDSSSGMVWAHHRRRKIRADHTRKLFENKY